MIKRKYSRGWIIFILLAVIITVVTLIIAYTPGVEDTHINVETLPWSEGWEVWSSSDIIIESNTLPESLPNGSSLLFAANNETVRVLVDKTVIFEGGENTKTHFGRSFGLVYYIANLPENAGGHKITVEYTNILSDLENKHSRSYRLGTADALRFYLLKKSLPIIIISVVTLLYAIFILALMYISDFHKRTKSVWRNITLFMVLSALWLGTQVPIMQFIIRNNAVSFFINNSIFLLIIMPFCLLSGGVFARYKRSYESLAYASGIYALLRILLFTIFGSSFDYLKWIYHIFILFVLVYTMYVCYHERRSRVSLWFFVGMSVMLLTCILALADYWRIPIISDLPIGFHEWYGAGVFIFGVLVLFTIMDRQRGLLLQIRSAERAQADLEHKFATAVGDMYINIFEIRPDEDIIYKYSMKNGSLIKRRANKPIDVILSDVIDNNCHPDDREKLRKLFDMDAFRELVKSGTNKIRDTIRYDDGEGGWLWARVVINGYYSAYRRLHAMLYIQNINEEVHDREMRMHELEKMRDALEIALKNAESANMAKSRFLSNMSHDMRTPMNTIIGMTDIALSNPYDIDHVQDCLQKVSVASHHLLGLINDVLDMSRIESGNMKLNFEPLNLYERFSTLSALMMPQIREKKQRFYIDTDGVKNISVIGDPTHLMQIFVNIVGNSCKFTPDEGEISIKVTEEPSGPEGYSLYKFVFTDTGVGMSPEFVAHLFNPFEREERRDVPAQEGTGLGMAITKSIVDMMGGSIICESESGRGTKFTVSIPMQHGEQQPLTVPENWRGKRALIVDDERRLCQIVSRILERLGLITEWTVSGRDAVEKATDAAESGKAYDIYFIDLQMPGINGFETLKRIRQAVGGNSPAYIMTAFDVTKYELSAKEAGAVTILAKPILPPAIAELLSSTAKDDVTPESPDKRNGHRAANISSTRNFDGKRILIAEDNELNLEIVSTILSITGVEIISALNGREAVQKYEESPPGTYSLILMDIQMPVMNGYEATRAIRASGRSDADIPIYAMTANIFDTDVHLSIKAGMNGHIGKPIDQAKLMEILNAVL